MDALRDLGIQSINFFAKSTHFIDRIIEQISTLLENGSAYRTEDGVYFRVSSFKEYGSLSGQPQESLLEGARVETNNLKESQRDFVIWKGKKEGEPFWPSPFGEGRPGWHIEDTAITETFFGYTYDIHGGGSDLIFPHHEAEIAIERSISHEGFLSKFWIHTGMLNLNSEKMSKSTGNFVSVESILEKWNRFDLRFAFLNAYYRSSLNLSEDMLAEARSNCTKFSNMYRRLKTDKFQGKGSAVLDGDWKKRMIDRFDDDMDIRGVISLINEFVYSINTSYSSLSSAEATEAVSILEWVNDILGIMDVSEKPGSNENLIRAVIDIRNAMRGKRDFETSDLIRKKLLEGGIYIEDKDTGTIWWEK
jgi:cysteinyl-tRNA synthetase